MPNDDEEDRTRYRVVVNDEAQYSIWPALREPPAGWRVAGNSGTRAECLAEIERVWTDMLPASLGRRLPDTTHDEGTP